MLLFLPAQKFNEEEYHVVYGGLKAAGYSIFIISDTNALCIGMSGLKVKNDVQLMNGRAQNFRAFVLIGGSGAITYYRNTILHGLIKGFFDAKKPLGAICLAPAILACAGVLKGLNAVSHPEGKRELTSNGARFSDLEFVRDGMITTATDASVVTEFLDSFLGSFAL